MASSLVPTSAAESLWLEDLPQRARPALQAEVTADVAVIGGGIAGVSIALALAREGASVALLEAERVGGGVSGTTTGKVSALQRTVYSSIADRHGDGTLAAYGAASGWAVDAVARTVEEEGIECDFQRRPARTYAATTGDLDTLEGEAAAAARAGLALSSDGGGDLPYPVAGALRLDNQIQLQPTAYVRGVADAAERAGATIYEHSRALSLHERGRPRVETGRGSVRAGQVVVATHFPVFDRGLYFPRMSVERSYCVALTVKGAAPKAMSISCGEETRSIRGFRRRLIVGGEGHAVGSASAQPERFERLEAFAREHWDVGRVTNRWSAQDPVPYDHLPFIGPYLPRSDRLFVATGFLKWGLTTGVFAGRVIADLIAGRDDAWDGAFSPSRVSARSLPAVAPVGLKTTKGLVADRLTPAEVGSSDEVPAGEARVVRDGAGKTGVYRDEEGTAHGVSLRCTHLGCLLSFNAAETTWDCACHGSRFAVDGEVLEGPAVRPLKRKPV